MPIVVQRRVTHPGFRSAPLARPSLPDAGDPPWLGEGHGAQHFRRGGRQDLILATMLDRARASSPHFPPVDRRTDAPELATLSAGALRQRDNRILRFPGHHDRACRTRVAKKGAHPTMTKPGTAMNRIPTMACHAPQRSV